MPRFFVSAFALTCLGLTLCAPAIARAYTVQAGDTPQSIAKKHNISVDELLKAKKNLKPGDLVFFYSPVHHVALYIGGGKIVHLSEPFTKEPLSWAIRRGDPDFLNWLNNFMQQVKYDGVYDKIYQKWFKDDAWLKEIQ